jgi:undecaprenyl-diphosphatase
MPDWLAAILLGLVEGLTEFIPVSSTGHLLMVEDWMMRHGIAKALLADAVRKEAFTIIVQSAAALALVPLFWRKFSGMLFQYREPENRDLLLKLSAAFLITCVVGMACKKMGLELNEGYEQVAWATLIGGFVILAVEAACRGRVMSGEITWVLALAFAGGQILAMIFPGASRSGSTIMLALALGMARPAATEFSFLLGVPTLLAAGGYELLKLFKSGALAGTPWGLFALGLAASGISAFIVVRWLIRFVQGHTFNGFAWYRILLGASLLVFAWMKGGGAACC